MSALDPETPDVTSPRTTGREMVHTNGGRIRLLVSLVVGIVGGLAIVVFHDDLVPDQFHRDSAIIHGLANGLIPVEPVASFESIARLYTALGLGSSPLLAGLVGYLVGVSTLIIALWRTRRWTASYLLSAYIIASCGLMAVYLGQYSKDLLVVPLVLCVLVAPRRLWWDILITAAALLYAYEFRSYWALTAVAYVVYRGVTWNQIRLRYLLIAGAVGSMLFGIAYWVVSHNPPNFFRVLVQDRQITEVNTSITPLFDIVQPWGGMVDIFVDYWLMLVPLLLPVTAGLPYAVIALAIVFVRIYPLTAAASSFRWPARSANNGVLLRRTLSLLLAFTATQAMFEPDYGSVLRHLTPLLPLGVALVQASLDGKSRVGRAQSWSLTGAAAAKAGSDSNPHEGR